MKEHLFYAFGRLTVWSFILLLTCAITIRAQVSVTATGGTLGPTSYTTLKGAFDAINAGTHQGVIAISISASTTETASAVLNTSAAPSSYTSVKISPTATSTISGNITGAVIRLNGADNVTIDGRLCGSGRALTIENTSTAAGTAAVWISSNGAGAGAVGNTIRNCEIRCGATQNTSANNTFGIIMCGTTISTTANGDDNDNNSFIENRIVRCRFGIVTRGVTTNNNQNVQILRNIIGPSSFGADQIGRTGILLQADNASTISDNVVQFVGGEYANTTAGADRVGIGIGSDACSQNSSTTITSGNYTVTGNLVHDIIDERTFSAVGIVLATTGGGSATNDLVANNCIYNVKANGTTGDYTAGIQITGGHTAKVVFNSIYLYGDVDPNAAATATTNFGCGIRITQSAATLTNLLVRNNAIHMDLSSSSTAAVRYYAIAGPITTYAWGTGSENYNDYYLNPANTQLLTGGLGTTPGNTLTTQFATLANWQTAYTAAQDANSVQLNPLFVSSTDLHLQATSPLINIGTAVAGVALDTDKDSRTIDTPDIGCDERQTCTGAVAPTITPNSTSLCAGQLLLLDATGMSEGTGITYQWEVSTTSGSGYTPISGATNKLYYGECPLTSGTYYYRMCVTCANGPVTACSSEVAITVLTASAAITGPSIYCAGSPGITLTESGGTATSWLWSPGGATTQSITVSPATTTTYTVVATTGTCTATATKTVTVSPAFTVTASASPTAVCAGGSTSLSASLSVSNTPPSSYCTSVPTSTTEDDIGQFTFAGILNPATAPSPQQSNAAANQTYNNFTGLTSAQGVLGSTYPATVYHFHGTTDVTTNYCNVYIDFNQNGSFSDAGETFVLTKPGGTFLENFVGNITIPATASLGLTRVRVLLREGAIGGPCDNASWGETEDYLINITGSPAVATYLWTDPAASTTNPITVSPASTTTYSVVAIMNGCPSSPSTVTVTVNPLPVVTCGNYGPYCLDDAAVTLGGTPSGGTWSGRG